MWSDLNKGYSSKWLTSCPEPNPASQSWIESLWEHVSENPAVNGYMDSQIHQIRVMTTSQRRGFLCTATLWKSLFQQNNPRVITLIFENGKFLSWQQNQRKLSEWHGESIRVCVWEREGVCVSVHITSATTGQVILWKIGGRPGGQGSWHWGNCPFKKVIWASVCCYDVISVCNCVWLK